MARFANPLKKSKTLVSLMGHSVEYPGRPAGGDLIYVHTPPLLVREAIAMGLAGEDELDEDDVKSPLSKKPTDGDELKKQLFDAFDILVEDNTASNFTAAGTPKQNPIERLVGYGIDHPELTAAWRAYQIARGEREEAKTDERAEAKKAVKAAQDAANKK